MNEEEVATAHHQEDTVEHDVLFRQEDIEHDLLSQQTNVDVTNNKNIKEDIPDDLPDPTPVIVHQQQQEEKSNEVEDNHNNHEQEHNTLIETTTPNSVTTFENATTSSGNNEHAIAEGETLMETQDINQNEDSAMKLEEHTVHHSTEPTDTIAEGQATLMETQEINQNVSTKLEEQQTVHQSITEPSAATDNTTVANPVTIAAALVDNVANTGESNYHPTEVQNNNNNNYTTPSPIPTTQDNTATVEAAAQAAAQAAAVAAAQVAAQTTAEEIVQDNSNKEDNTIVVEDGAIWEPSEMDVLSGRGASINTHPGNKKFRALCFSRKPLFDQANHAAKRRIAIEIWTTAKDMYGCRYLKKKQNKGPWYIMSDEKAILKAAQVMRDYKRPDRLLQREVLAATGRKRNRNSATPMEDIPPPPVQPLQECPEGVTPNDVLCGRGAFVNGHSGNVTLRKMAQARKDRFDAGNYTEKRALATEIVHVMLEMDPPGRFLRKRSAASRTSESGPSDSGNVGEWEELDMEKSIHKACQVMRDIDRSDRKHREERRKVKKARRDGKFKQMRQTIEAAKATTEAETAAAANVAAAVTIENQIQEQVILQENQVVMAHDPLINNNDDNNVGEVAVAVASPTSGNELANPLAVSVDTEIGCSECLPEDEVTTV